MKLFFLHNCLAVADHRQRRLTGVLPKAAIDILDFTSYFRAAFGNTPNVGCNTMNRFTTKYNYLILIARFTFFLMSLVIFFRFIFFAAPRFIQDQQSGVKLVFGLIAGCIIVVFLPYRFAKLLWTQRIILTVLEGAVTIKDAVSKNEYLLDVDKIKGFSLSTYPTKIYNFKEIILYLHDGSKIELPQFLYWNHREIEDALLMCGITFLGAERFKWRFPDSRKYQFD